MLVLVRTVRTIYVLSKNKKNINNFLLNFQFLQLKKICIAWANFRYVLNMAAGCPEQFPFLCISCTGLCKIQDNVTIKIILNCSMVHFVTLHVYKL